MKNVARLCFFFSLAASLVPAVNAFCAGSVRQFEVPAGAARRNLSVYLPGGYGESAASYPVLYLLHGFNGDEQTFFGTGYKDGAMSDANVAVIVDRLVEEGKIRPLIVACPALGLDTDVLRYVVPFVDATFRTIPRRESRAVAGHCAGGYSALFLALGNPDVFSVAGGFSVLAPSETTARELIKAGALKPNPVAFWLYAGTQDYGAPRANRSFAKLLSANGIDATYTEDDGNHNNKVGLRLVDFLEYLSSRLEW